MINVQSYNIMNIQFYGLRCSKCDKIYHISKEIADYIYDNIQHFLSPRNHYLMLFGYGFCLSCHRFTTDLHDSSSQGYHCYECCNDKDVI